MSASALSARISAISISLYINIMARLLFKLAVAGVVVGITASALLNWRRGGNYDRIQYKESSDSIIAKLGDPVDIYMCEPEKRTMIDQVDAFCQQSDVAQVMAFRPCTLPFICAIKTVVAFDGDGRMAYKAHMH